ncbi:sensor histidine kinase [Rugosimonospora africana]|uniref:histidine kinase n=1 Tax=Rugosimonospora africana TaxID=556532 RepID=A0A8J3QLL8_9ACTN|nr:ATP-binding protein [Rugosimonospora africana]GIH11975.1 two-component sensor histidine kinase [Rugosimonospora africana]
MIHPFSRTPLRLKLVAAVMALVTATLLVIGVSSALALRQYLVGRLDSDVRTVARDSNALSIENYEHPATQSKVALPSMFFAELVGPTGLFQPIYDTSHYKPEDLPVVPQDASTAAERLDTVYTVPSADGGGRWRILVTQLVSQPGDYLMIAADMSDVDSALSRLIVAELLVGAGMLILLAVAGTAMVQASLRPLRSIEHTAAAIAGGDLTQRIPEFEPGHEEPRTEVGHLARSLNTMLGQVEAAFTAQTASEAAARSAESAARDAAEAARLSESRARRSEERMRQFVADASHELRTPLTTIRGFAELYRQGAARAPEEAERLIRRIEGEAARMGLLVEDLLLLARLDMERPLVPGDLELRVIANDAVIAAQAVSPDRQITLEIADDTGPLTVSGDESRLRQVMGNLMTNALVHTPPGTPVWLRLRREAEQAVVEIADAGPGLAPEQIEHVFERFYRADTARTRRDGGSAAATSGTGLGLAIVAALVAAHRGSVEVESQPGQGATFRVRLPLVQSRDIEHVGAENE